MGLDVQVFLTGQEAIDYVQRMDAYPEYSIADAKLTEVATEVKAKVRAKRKPRVVKIKNEDMSTRISEFHKHLGGGKTAIDTIEALFAEKLDMKPINIREPNQEQMVGMMKLIEEEMTDAETE